MTTFSIAVHTFTSHSVWT